MSSRLLVGEAAGGLRSVRALVIGGSRRGRTLLGRIADRAENLVEQFRVVRGTNLRASSSRPCLRASSQRSRSDETNPGLGFPLGASCRGCRPQAIFSQLLLANKALQGNRGVFHGVLCGFCPAGGAIPQLNGDRSLANRAP